MTKKIYLLENIDCANCAAKIEHKIAQLPGVEEATLTFATRQLRITAENPDELLPQIQQIADAIEPGTVITERKRRKNTNPARHEHHHHEHGDSCDCGHDHHEHSHQPHSHHEHGDSCDCGHDHHEHSHQPHSHHEHGDSCDCGHDHHEHNHQPHSHHEHGDSCDCGHDHHEHNHQPHSHHEHGDSCDCGHDHHEHNHQPEASAPAARKLSENQQDLLVILLGAAFFAVGIVLEHSRLTVPAIILFVIAYLLLGSEIVLSALKNLVKGHIFDENFLMSIATLGAFAIREWPEAVGVMLFFRVGEFFEHVAVEKSRSQIMDALDMRPEVVNLVDGDEIRVIDAEDANAGDILLVRAGDRIPLDGVVVDGESRIDTSPITGEPVPVKVESGSTVISGCVNTSGLLKIRVEKILEESMVTRILDSVENAAASKPKIDRFITRFARIYTPIVVLLAIGTAVIPSLFSGNWNYWIYTALSFLVMSCPCALVLSVPLAFFSGIGAGSKRGILFKGGVSLEAMAHIDAVVMDKTGTITEGNFVVQKVFPTEEITEEELLSLCGSCELSSTHPIGESIVKAAAAQNLNMTRPDSVEEIAGHGIRAILSGEEILCGNEKLMERFKIPMNGYKKSSNGTEVLAAKNGIFVGSIVISDTIKKDAKSAISTLKNQKIITAMLTGDRESSAHAVAKEIGIDEVHARLLPEDKLNKLQEIRKKHGAVMFVGDGINDAPVLAGADVGAAMGSGADAAIEAADVVFMTSNMEAIPRSLAIARAATQISWQNVIFALVIKIAVMILGLCGFASMWMAVFADTGVAMLCILNSIRILYKK